jgi:hypothetical protein
MAMGLVAVEHSDDDVSNEAVDHSSPVVFILNVFILTFYT